MVSAGFWAITGDKVGQYVRILEAIVLVAVVYWIVKKKWHKPSLRNDIKIVIVLN